MVESNRGNRSAALTKAHIADVDQRFASPSERASHVWSILRTEHPELTDWDIVCFSAEYLGMMSRVHLWLEDAAKQVTGLVYAAHYMNAEQIDAKSSIKRSPIAPRIEPVHHDKERDSGTEHEGDSTGVVRTRFFT